MSSSTKTALQKTLGESKEISTTPVKKEVVVRLPSENENNNNVEKMELDSSSVCSKVVMEDDMVEITFKDIPEVQGEMSEEQRALLMKTIQQREYWRRKQFKDKLARTHGEKLILEAKQRMMSNKVTQIYNNITFVTWRLDAWDEAIKKFYSPYYNVTQKVLLGGYQQVWSYKKGGVMARFLMISYYPRKRKILVQPGHGGFTKTSVGTWVQDFRKIKATMKEVYTPTTPEKHSILKPVKASSKQRELIIVGDVPSSLAAGYQKAEVYKSREWLEGMPTGCPPYCRPTCAFIHHRLLWAVLACRDDDNIDVMHHRLAKFVEMLKMEQAKTGWDVNKDIDEKVTAYRMPIAHWTAALGCFAATKWLLENGHDPDLQSGPKKLSALHRALITLQECCDEAERKLEQFVPLLESNLMLQNTTGNLPLHTACEMLHYLGEKSSYYPYAIKLFINHMKDISHQSMVKMVNAQNNAGNTALHILAQTDAHAAMVKFLIQSGASINIKNKSGQTCLDMAKSRDQNCFLTCLDSLKKEHQKTIRNLYSINNSQSESVQRHPVRKEDESAEPPTKKQRLENGQDSISNDGSLIANTDTPSLDTEDSQPASISEEQSAACVEDEAASDVCDTLSSVLKSLAKATGKNNTALQQKIQEEVDGMIDEHNEMPKITPAPNSVAIPLSGETDAFVKFVESCSEATRQSIEDAMQKDREYCLQGLSVLEMKHQDICRQIEAAEQQHQEDLDEIQVLLKQMTALQQEESFLKGEVAAKNEELFIQQGQRARLTERLNHCKDALDVLNMWTDLREIFTADMVDNSLSECDDSQGCEDGDEANDMSPVNSPKNMEETHEHPLRIKSKDQAVVSSDKMVTSKDVERPSSQLLYYLTESKCDHTKHLQNKDACSQAENRDKICNSIHNGVHNLDGDDEAMGAEASECEKNLQRKGKCEGLVSEEKDIFVQREFCDRNEKGKDAKSEKGDSDKQIKNIKEMVQEANTEDQREVVIAYNREKMIPENKCNDLTSVHEQEPHKGTDIDQGTYIYEQLENCEETKKNCENLPACDLVQQSEVCDET